jgi:phospholipid/cholesterol/gamma-HCH transport system substrate-binding protein
VRNSRTIGRVAALAAVVVGVVAVVVVLLGSGGDEYTYKARFINASQLVNGDQIEIGGTPVGTINDIKLTDNGQAEVAFTLERKYGPLREGTRAIVRQASLSGIANRYIDIQPGPGTGTALDEHNVLGTSHTTTAVDLDQIFNVFGLKQRRALSQLIRGFGDTYAGHSKQANAGWVYLNPALASSARLFEAFNSDPNELRRFIDSNGKLVTDVAVKQADLSNLVNNLANTTSAIGSQRAALADAIQNLPPFMRKANSAFVNLRATLNDLQPLVDESKPVAKKLRPFLRQLRPLAVNARPTLRDLSQLVSKAGPNNDLIDLNNSTVPLRDIAIGPVQANGKQREGAFPASTKALSTSIPELADARPYAVDLTGWFSDFSTPGVYDALGAASNAGPYINIASNVGGVMKILPPNLRAQAFAAAATTGQNDRCPGTAERNPSFKPPSGFPCDPSQLPPGP